MRELEHEWRDRGLERPFRIRMGISTGFCTVGNFGSQDRMDYTIIGNEVNLASRLQTSAEPGSILLAHETNALVSDIVLTEEQPPITVKGFAKPINTYKIAGTYDELVETGRVVLQERKGMRVLVDLIRQANRKRSLFSRKCSRSSGDDPPKRPSCRSNRNLGVAFERTARA